MDRNFPDNKINDSLRHGLMMEDIAQFPKGMDTVLGQRGVSLSGGQKQRLAIARTLIRRPKLLLLDDCTAAMDANTESFFWKGLQKEFPDTTIKDEIKLNLPLHHCKQLSKI